MDPASNSVKLHNLWMVTEVDGKEVTTEDFSKEIPVIEIDLTEGFFRGSNGCNQIRGSVSEDQGLLSFGMAISTRMACEKAEISDRITELLSNTQYRYAFVKNSLILYQDDTEFLRFRNVD